jgi:hypothetical protein
VPPYNLIVFALLLAIAVMMTPPAFFRPRLVLAIDPRGKFHVRRRAWWAPRLPNVHFSLGSVLAGIFSPVASDIEAFGKKVESDIVTWLKAEEVVVVDYAQEAWTQILPILTGIPSSQLTILIALIKTAAADLAAGDYAGIYTAVLAQATTAETAFIAGLSAQFVQAWAVIVTYKPPTPASAS